MNVLSGKQQTKIDVFRIAAALFVLLGHALGYFSLTIFKDQTYFAYIQCIGVVMFFTLSGYLTAFSLERNNRSNSYDIKTFLGHKFSRIYGEYIWGILFITLIDILAIRINGTGYSYYGTFNFKYFIGNLLMLQGMGTNHIPEFYLEQFGSGRPLWTISVEWWFYWVFGILYLCIKNKRNLNWKYILLLAVSTMLSMDYFRSVGVPFIIGIIVYYCAPLVSRKTARALLPVAVVSYILCGIKMKDAYTIFSYLLMGVILGSYIQLGSEGDDKGRNRVISFLSRSTFMLYLIHYSIIDFICNFNCRFGARAKFLISVSLSMAISIIMYYLLAEKLSNNVRKKIYICAQKMIEHRKNGQAEKEV